MIKLFVFLMDVNIPPYYMRMAICEGSVTIIQSKSSCLYWRDVILFLLQIQEPCRTDISITRNNIINDQNIFPLVQVRENLRIFVILQLYHNTFNGQKCYYVGWTTQKNVLLKHLFILLPVSSLTLSETQMEETIKLGFVKEEIFTVDS